MASLSPSRRSPSTTLFKTCSEAADTASLTEASAGSVNLHWRPWCMKTARHSTDRALTAAFGLEHGRMRAVGMEPAALLAGSAASGAMETGGTREGRAETSCVTRDSSRRHKCTPCWEEEAAWRRAESMPEDVLGTPGVGATATSDAQEEVVGNAFSGVRRRSNDASTLGGEKTLTVEQAACSLRLLASRPRELGSFNSLCGVKLRTRRDLTEATTGMSEITVLKGTSDKFTLAVRLMTLAVICEAVVGVATIAEGTAGVTAAEQEEDCAATTTLLLPILSAAAVALTSAAVSAAVSSVVVVRVVLVTRPVATSWAAAVEGASADAAVCPAEVPTLAEE